MPNNWGKVPGAEIPENIKRILVRLVKEGLKVAKAARALGVKQSTASKIWKKYRTTSIVTNWKCTGCPKKVTPAIACKVLIDSKQNRQIPFIEIGNTQMHQVSATTICCILAKANRACQVAVKAPFHTPEQCVARLK
jgi:predicted transcriptional regulator